MNQVLTLLQSHPQWAAVQTIYHRLVDHGYRAFLAGGCVRDALLNIEANDLDIATDATPDQVEALFEKTVNVGKVFGVMRVLVDGADLEVATFRHDGNYSDGRRPESILFSSPEEDAQRRDFTINALFFDLQSHQVLDFVQGQQDLQSKLIKTVGDPRKRFSEDHLRLLRGARFAAQLGFSVETQTLAAMTEMASLVQTVSGERIRDEMGKLLKSPQVSLGLSVMQQTGLLEMLFPWVKKPLSWSYPREFDVWKNLSLFFREADRKDLDSSLNLLKLSTNERRFIVDAWGLWKDEKTFFELRRGLQLQLLQKPGIQWGLQVLLMRDPQSTEILSLFSEQKALGETLPKAFLNGEDLKGLLQGEAIGRCLQEAYCLQLEMKIRHREAALLWLRDYLNNTRASEGV